MVNWTDNTLLNITEFIDEAKNDTEKYEIDLNICYTINIKRV